MASAVRQRKRTLGTGGVSLIEKTSMYVKDHAQKVPESVVVHATIVGHQVRALVDISLVNLDSMIVPDLLPGWWSSQTRPYLRLEVPVRL